MVCAGALLAALWWAEVGLLIPAGVKAPAWPAVVTMLVAGAGAVTLVWQAASAIAGRRPTALPPAPARDPEPKAAVAGRPRRLKASRDPAARKSSKRVVVTAPRPAAPQVATVAPTPTTPTAGGDPAVTLYPTMVGIVKILELDLKAQRERTEHLEKLLQGAQQALAQLEAQTRAR